MDHELNNVEKNVNKMIEKAFVKFVSDSKDPFEIYLESKWIITELKMCTFSL